MSGSALAQERTAAGLEGHRHPLCVAHANRTGEKATEICGITAARGGAATSALAAAAPASRDGQIGAIRGLPALPASIVEADLVLIGEVHDNPVHHRLQAAMLAHRAVLRRRQGLSATALVMEHLRPEHIAAISAFNRDRSGTADAAAISADAALAQARDLLDRLNWSRSGWPAAWMFEPVFQAAIVARLPILPADPAREEVRSVARGGFDRLPAATQQRLQLGVALPPPLAAALGAELDAGHCGMLPAAAVPNMAAAQVYRDAHQADALLQAATLHGSAVLLAGNGHVRTDRGVGWHISRRDAGRSLVSVALVEVADGVDDIAAYVPRDPAGVAAVDYVILTLRTSRSDPCAPLRARRKTAP